MNAPGASKYLPALAKKLADHGTNGDDQIAHMTTGEQVIPLSVQKKNPKLMKMLDQAYMDLGMDPAAYRVGHPAGNNNDKTGAEAFWDGGTSDTSGGVDDGGEDAPGDEASSPGFGGPDGSDVTDSDMQGAINEADADAAQAAAGWGGEVGAAINEAFGFDKNHGYAGKGTTDADAGWGPEGRVSTPGAITSISELDKNLAGLFGGITGSIGMAMAENALANGGTVTESDFSGTADERGGLGGSEPKDQVKPSEEGKPKDPVNSADAEDPLTISVTRSSLIPGDLYTPRRGGSTRRFSDAMSYLETGGNQINPETGLPMFADQASFDADAYLAANPDVAQNWSGDAWDHYQKYGKNENRVANASEQAARDRGYTGGFGDGGYVAWEQEQANKGLTDGAGGSFIEGASNATQAAERKAARATGYEGEFGGGGYQRYLSGYFDHDNDPNTAMVARPEANVNRRGEDASYVRNLYRDAGYDRHWGDGGADEFLRNAMSKYSLSPTGNTVNDLYALRDAQSRPQPREAPTRYDPSQYLPAWMRGVRVSTAGPLMAPQAPVTNALDVFSRLTPTRRNRFASYRGRVQSPSFMG